MVHIYDDASAEWSDNIIGEQARQEISQKAIAIKLHATSQDAAMFGQLFPIQSVPSIFLVKSGTLCAFLPSDTTEQQFFNAINAADGRVGSTHASNSSVSSVPSITTNTHHGPTPTASLPSSVAATSFPAPAAGASLPAILSPTASPASSDPTILSEPNTSIPSPSSSASSPAQIERLRAQLAERRKLREEEEKDAAKKRELERRAQQKAQQSIQQSLEEKEQAKIVEEKRKERLAEAEHKKRIKDQIAADKAERQARRERELAMRKTNSEQGSISSLSRSSTSSPSVSSRSMSSSSCALVVRLLDGSTIKNTFSAADTLDKVREWIDSSRTDGTAPYILMKTFPNHQFTAMEETKPLREIDLCPSATLICKPTKKAAEAYTVPSSIVGSVAGSGLSLVRGGIGLAYGVVNSVWSGRSRNAPSIEESERGRAVGNSSTDAAAAAAERRAASGNSTGNIHSLQRDDNDKQQFYNGNSVNQE